MVALAEAQQQLEQLGRPAHEIQAVRTLFRMASYFAQHGDITAAEWIRGVMFRLGSQVEQAEGGLYQTVPDIPRPEGLSLPSELQAEVDRQIAEVKKTFTGSMREILTRIPFFKEWFGDWEKAEHPVAWPYNANSAPFISQPNTQARSVVHGYEPNIHSEDGNVNGTSVVINEKGEPLPVYHGTPSRFEVFRRGDVGFHFGTREHAEHRVSSEEWDGDGYTREPDEGAGILVGYLNIRNPLYLPIDIQKWTGDVLAEAILYKFQGVLPFDLSEADYVALKRIANLPEKASNHRMRKWLISKGFDGVAYPNDTEESSGEGNLSYIIFSPAQFKSADNLGTFDPRAASFYRQGKKGMIQFQDSYKAVITLFETADASTLIHEFGHYAFEMMRGLVEAGLADARMTQDFEVLRKWSEMSKSAVEKGYKNYVENFKPEYEGQTPLSKEVWQDIQQKEKLARGFEAYFMEGTAPSTELAGAFATIRRMLTYLYKVVSALGVKVTSEVRRVIDGMLASDAAVEKHSIMAQAAAVVNTELLGLSQEEAKAFRGLIEKSREQAVADMDAEKNRKLKELRPEWRRAAEDAARKDPIIAAMQTLESEGGLDFNDVLEIAGEETALALAERGLTTPHGRKIKAKTDKDGNVTDPGGYKNAKPGMFPPDFAAAHNFESVEEMLLAFLDAPSFSEFVNDYMEQAEAAFHKDFEMSDTAQATDATFEALDRMEEALRQKGGREGYKARKAELRERVRKHIAGKSVSWLLSDKQEIGICRDQARKLTKAVNEKDYAAALDAAGKLRLHLEILRQKGDARKAAEKAIVKFRKAYKAKKGVIYGDHHEALKELAFRFGFTKAQPKGEHTIESVIAEYNADAKKYDSSAPIELPVWVARGNAPYTALTADAFFELMQFADFVEGEGRMLVSAEKEAFNNEVADLKERSLEELRLHAAAHKRNKGAVAVAEYLSNAGSKLRNMLGEAAMWEENSALMQLYNMMNMAESMQGQLMLKPMTDCTAALKALDASTKGMKLEGLPAFTDFVRRKHYPVWTREMVIAAALNLGNAKNRRRLIDGFGWTEADLNNIASRLTAADWQNIQKVWDAIGGGELSKTVKEQFKKEYHFDMTTEPALPFTVTTADGQTIEVEGGYYPLKYLSDNIEQPVSKEKPDFRRVGLTQDRAEGRVTKPVRLSLSVIPKHISEAAHYASHRVIMRKVMRVMKSEKFREEFSTRQGFDRYEQMMKIVEHVNDPAALMGFQESMFFRIGRAMLSAGALFANPSVIAMQFASVTVGLEEVKGHYLDAVQQFWANPAETLEMIMQHSGFMRDRASLQDIDLRRELRLLSDSEIKNNVEKLRQAGYWLMRKADMAVSVPAWLAAYNKAIEEGKQPNEASAIADEFVAKTQGGARPIDLSPSQLDAWGRLFTVFFSAVSAASTSATRTLSKIRHGKLTGTAAVAAIAANIIMPFFILQPLIRWAVAGGSWGDEDDEKKKGKKDNIGRANKAFLRELVTGPFGGIPYVRDVADFAAGVIVDKRSNADMFEVGVAREPSRVGSLTINALGDLSQGNWSRMTYRLAQAAEMYFGVPALRTYNRVRKFYVNQTGNKKTLPDLNELTKPKKEKR